jgi:hypothetical protein
MKKIIDLHTLQEQSSIGLARRVGQDPRDHDHKLHDHDHTVCQKLKAENECFVQSCRSRFWNGSLKHWKLSTALQTQILEIIELLLTEEPKNQHSDFSCSQIKLCSQIKSLNEFHKLQFFKASFLIENLEKSKLSPIHLHRISIFLQTKIFSDLCIKDFFEEMMSITPLYECKSCKLHAPIDADLHEIVKYFYTSVRHLCKTCFKKSMKSNYDASRSKTKKDPSDPSGLSNDKLEESDGPEVSLKPLTKMYLCMKCGEDNYVNFYERNKSKCKFCILSEKRGIDGIDERRLAPSASKDHHCKYCHTEDPKNFRETYKSVCYACYLLEKKAKYASDPSHSSKSSGQNGSSKSDDHGYFCKNCETTVPSRFRRGYKSQCYECFLYEKKKLTVLKDPLEPEVPMKDLKDTFKPPKVLCKYCSDSDSRNFNEGMASVCARCEPLDSETFICKSCSLECLRNCFTPSEMAKPPGDRLCNLCDPVALEALASERKRKEFKCNNCEESRPEEFYSGFKGKCKACVKRDRKEGYRNGVSGSGTKSLDHRAIALGGVSQATVHGTERREIPKIQDNEYIRKPKSVKDYDCMICGTNIPSEFYLGHKSKCKNCM